MAEKICRHPKILDLLENEEIGYHSSAHSVRPIILEYTDIKEYDLARQISLRRETRHINPLTGELEGKGGIVLLRKLFPNKRIVSFRAPGFSYSPPHLEALKEIGMVFDFSADFSSIPIDFKGVTFYPFPFSMDSFKTSLLPSLFRQLMKSHITVFVFHPSFFVNAYHWDSIYFSGNPRKLYPVQARAKEETKNLFKKLEIFLKGLSYFEKRNLCEVTPALERGARKIKINQQLINKNYLKSIAWSKKYFEYKPKFIFSHFLKFFGSES
jgi:hypothetical protein